MTYNKVLFCKGILSIEWIGYKTGFIKHWCPIPEWQQLKQTWRLRLLNNTQYNSNEQTSWRNIIHEHFSRIKYIIPFPSDICGTLLELSKLSKSAWPSKMGPIGCPETSVRNYHSTLRKNPKERRSHLHRGRSLKSHKAVSHCLYVSVLRRRRVPRIL